MDDALNPVAMPERHPLDDDDAPTPAGPPGRGGPVEATGRRPRFQFSMALVMMIVVAAGASAALFAKARAHIPATNQAYIRFDAPALFVGSIALTALALGSLKGHTLGQVMLQITLACLGCLSLIGLAEAKLERPLLYWFQTGFAVLVALPMFARRFVKSEIPRGPRRTWWKNNLEASVFAFLTLGLVLLGVLLQFLVAFLAPQALKL